MNRLFNGYYFPLEAFDWTGGEFDVCESASIFPGSGIIDAMQEVFPDFKLQNEFGRARYDEVHAAKYWLVVKTPTNREDAENTAALFLWSLWLAASTRVKIHAQFEFFQGRDQGHLGPRWWTSTYEFNPTSPVDAITIEVLQKVKEVLPKVLNIYDHRDELPRLTEAMFLTHLGCKDKNWQAAFILWMASLETLVLEPKDPKGFTFTVCSRSARLLSSSKAQYDAFHNEMEDLYSIRSDIVHGRFGARAWDTNYPNDRLNYLSRLEGFLKSLWGKVLLIQNLEGTLEMTSDRDVFFSQTVPSF